MGKINSKEKRAGSQKKSRHVSLEVSDDKENVHTFTVDERLLSSQSSVFRRLSESGVLRKSKVVSLNNISFLGLQRILQFLEAGDVTFQNYKEALETVRAALEYRIDSAKEVCIEYLITKLDPSNVCEIYEFSEIRGLYELVYECLRIIDKKANEVLESPGFLKLNLPRLISITKRGNLNLRSEFCLLRAIVEWGKQEMVKRGVLPDQTQVFIDIISPALDNMRCKTMSNRKHNAPEFSEAYKYLLSKRLFTERAQALERPLPRHYQETFNHELGVLDSFQIMLSRGDCFHLKTEVLKGRIFFLGVSLALKAMSSSLSSAACLYVVLTATNDITSEKKKVRHTFFNVNSDTSLKLRRPLAVKENELFTIELKVKLTGKILPLVRRNEADVFSSPEGEVAMKIFPQSTSQKIVKCIFKEIIYYF